MTADHGTPGGDRPPTGVRNELSGSVFGSVVQGRDIDVHLHAPSPPARPRPDELLPAPAHFTDREAELGELTRLLDADTPDRAPLLAVLGGTGGVGKTALALHWLHQVHDRFPDGLLYVDLRGFSGTEPVPPGDALGRFLRALGVAPDHVPTELDEQSALFRSLTAGRRIAIMADDAASAAQVRALLPGTGRNLVAVTSRRAISGLVAEGARFIGLAPLDERAAVQLLGRLIGDDRTGAEPDAARSLAGLCGRLPLALRASGARLVARKRWRLARMVGELSDERRRITALSGDEESTVQAVFDLSYAALDTDAALLYRRLGLHPGPRFEVAAAAVLAEFDPGRCETLLEELVDANLVEEVGTDRYGLHDLVRVHARNTVERSDEPAHRHQAVRRVVDWYLNTAASADLVVMPGRWRLGAQVNAARHAPCRFDTTASALSWLEAELPNLLAAQQAAADAGWHDRAWQICEALWSLFLYRRNYADWIASHERGLASATACGDIRAQAWVTDHLGLAYLYSRRLDEAEPMFTRALELERATDHPIGTATVTEHLGLIALGRGHTDEAIVFFATARETLRTLDRPRGYALMTRRIGEAHRDAGRDPEAIAYLTEARSRFAELGDRYQEARSATGLAETRLRTGATDQIVESLDRALVTMRSQGASFEQARIHSVLAEALERLGRRERAGDQLRRALTLYRELRAPQAEQVRHRLDELIRHGPEQPGHPRVQE